MQGKLQGAEATGLTSHLDAWKGMQGGAVAEVNA